MQDDDHPFSKALPGDVLEAVPEAVLHRCPLCKSDNFRAITNQYGLTRICNECKNEWSGGMAGVVPDPFAAPPGIASFEDDYPNHPYIGPEFNPYGDDY